MRYLLFTLLTLLIGCAMFDYPYTTLNTKFKCEAKNESALTTQCSELCDGSFRTELDFRNANCRCYCVNSRARENSRW